MDFDSESSSGCSSWDADDNDLTREGREEANSSILSSRINSSPRKQLKDALVLNRSPGRVSHDAKSNAERTVIHLDVDCFYCQCESLSDRTGKLALSPFAIQQKHIIVTCNYIARKLGIKKLMLKEEAVRICPDLVIVDGSDLTLYRREARKIYSAFREAVHSPTGARGNSTAKGGMDEMYADITSAVTDKNHDASQNEACFFVYGDQSSTVLISEDQSGAEASVSLGRASLLATDGVEPSPLQNNSMDAGSHPNSNFGTEPSTVTRWGNLLEREACVKRLHVGAALAAKIKRVVREKTGFSTCIGVSVSPMLSKIAAELKKPDSLNVLYPWRSSSIILSMPLRRIPELGSRTLKALDACLRNHVPPREQDWWTCRDLLVVPRNSVVASLDGPTSEQKADMFLQRCRGIDESLVVDDGGGLAKTVSIEDSYKRGTMLSLRAVWDVLEDLFVRLLKLLDERKWTSDRPELAFPTTFRVTIRNRLENENKRGRNNMTISKQCPLNGKKLLSTEDSTQKIKLLRHVTGTLLDALIPPEMSTLSKTRDKINVTKINLAATNFADVKENTKCGKRLAGGALNSVAEYFSLDASTRKAESSHSSLSPLYRGADTSPPSQPNCVHAIYSSPSKITKSMAENVEDVSISQSRMVHTKTEETKVGDETCTTEWETSSFSVLHTKQNSSQCQNIGKDKIPLPQFAPVLLDSSSLNIPLPRKQQSTSIITQNIPDDIDPSFLSELPSDIVEEILQNHQIEKKKKKKMKIEDFFHRGKK